MNKIQSESASPKDLSGITESPTQKQRDIPISIYLLGLTIFILTTSEFMVVGMMPSLTGVFGVTVADIGYLISLYAIGMVVGGPILTALFVALRIPNKKALLWLLALYSFGGIIAATAGNYLTMAIARVITGVAGSACIGISLAICGEVVRTEMRGRASSIVLGGMMLATVLGVPAATVIDQHLGWRLNFWLVVIFTITCSFIVWALVPVSRNTSDIRISDQLTSFRNGKLWAAYATSALIIGASYAAFSYISAILTEVTGLQPTIVPILLGLYGVANVIGNTITGRFADQQTFVVLTIGISILAISLLIFALFPENRYISVIAFLIIGLVGVPMSPAMITRVMRVANAGPLVSSVHVSIINSGLAFIAWAGGLSIGAGYGLISPLWIGLILAIFALLSLTPRSVRISITPPKVR
ncbi:MFS transporter [Xenorhabdus doucetiae]|uniref:MFS family arabinose efflux permease n=1 Tax=Xenorhabdus doucetiae TaxID=351671 RepID=A0A068QNF5_9GAMM|nr:MFS transporter [Xenorhabdus doucetiae]TYO99745.1 putative MFS family arabinose efflux permease [Xenorhabdus doucetiae]CDG16106.1 putative Transmembrane efflux protein of the MFS type [Xenorhabdus doucetiae]